MPVAMEGMGMDIEAESVPAPASNARLQRQVQTHHAHCWVCGTSRPLSLGLHFEVVKDGVVEGAFPCPFEYCGYDGILHGGVIAALLDAAMTNCLFAHGIAAYTADLHLRYKIPVRTENPVKIRATLEHRYPPLYQLRAELYQAEILHVQAQAKFMAREGEITAGTQTTGRLRV